MRWRKMGKIFDPTDYPLINECTEYAQSPQTIVFSDFVRIYFSTRKKDSTGKYLSHVAFVDMDKEFKQVLNISTNTVIELGKLGCFDEHGIFPMNVVRQEDRIYGYTCGWNRKGSVSVDTSIGLAISHDNGLTFNKVGEGPIMSASLNEPFLVGDPFVKIIDNVFHMWYIYGTEWKMYPDCQVPERIYKIAHATSIDGFEWNRESKQIIEDRFIDECQALPSVIYINDTYHMFFCYRQSYDFRKNKSRGYRIGYAYSKDLIHWIRQDDNVGIDVTEGSWDSEMICYPHVFQCEGKVYMLYNGNEFGRYGFGIALLEGI